MTTIDVITPLSGAGVGAGKRSFGWWRSRRGRIERSRKLHARTGLHLATCSPGGASFPRRQLSAMRSRAALCRFGSHPSCGSGGARDRGVAYRHSACEQGCDQRRPRRRDRAAAARVDSAGGPRSRRQQERGYGLRPASPTCVRKGFDRLAMLVQEKLQHDHICSKRSGGTARACACLRSGWRRVASFGPRRLMAAWCSVLRSLACCWKASMGGCRCARSGHRPPDTRLLFELCRPASAAGSRIMAVLALAPPS
jgi:hypothetical protein